MIAACPSEARSADQSARSAEKIFHVFILAMKKRSRGISTHFMFCSLERLRLTPPAVKQPKRPPLYSVSLIRLHGKKQQFLQ